ncbi:phage baseplate assembly protein V [Streptomyces griseorubiginosus]|uniref:phage baseplate assembly protein V n=1 Tax=Streptomyces griseorubiginosus TaxID=67304 RepID=UPI0011407BD6|nr:phage baseplate assembly protein V [Streptomyces griseorubiginosus]
MTLDLERVVADLADKVERRYYGKYRGIVRDNEDPSLLGRLKVSVPSLLGPDVVTGWAAPCVPYGGAADQGFLFVPGISSGVWVEFEEGDLEFPVWVGTYWTAPDAVSQVPKPQDDDGTERADVQNPPTRKIIKTLKGHTLQFEDRDGAEAILVREGARGHLIALTQDGIRITDATGNTVEMTDSAMTLHAAVPFTIDAPGQPVRILGDTIDFQKG